jgi:hypothetical protein
MRVNGLKAGDDAVRVFVQPVRVNGPPAVIRLCGNSDCYFSGVTTNATLSVTVPPQ